MLYGRPGYAGIAPLADGRAMIAAAADPDHLGSTPGVTPLAALLAQLGLDPGSYSNAHTQPGVPALTRRRAAFESDDHVLVAGDASGYLEPFTGEGMTWALEAAERVALHAAAIVAGRYSPGAWHTEHTRARRRNRVLCTGVTALLRRPSLTRAAITTLTAAPAAASLAESAVRALQHTPRAHAKQAGAV